MPKDEVDLFCGCVASDVDPNLNSEQKRLLSQFRGHLKPESKGVPQGLIDQFAVSGIRDLIVAAQTRCSDALYSTPGHINLKSNDGGKLFLYCDPDSMVPTASFEKEHLLLATEDEIERAIMAVATKPDGNWSYPVAEVSWRVDGGPPTIEYWDVNLAGNGVDVDVAGKLIKDMRFADTLDLTVSRGKTKYSGRFRISGKIPATWRPCSVRKCLQGR